MKQIGHPLFKSVLFLIVGALVLTACGGDDPEHDLSDIDVADASVSIDFSNPDDFETDVFENGSTLAIENDEYVITSTNLERNQYVVGKSIWGEDGTAHYPTYKNVRVEVEAQPRAGEDDNWYGVMCRVDEAGSGYTFLISADGFWAIALSNGREFSFLENWREADAIKRGNSRNTIQAYCVDDYLALYVNGDFVGDHRNSDLNDVGGFGVVAGGKESNRISVVFDDLVVSEINFEGKPNTPAPTMAATDTPAPIETQTLEVPEITPPSLDSFGPVVTEEVTEDEE